MVGEAPHLAAIAELGRPTPGHELLLLLRRIFGSPSPAPLLREKDQPPSVESVQKGALPVAGHPPASCSEAPHRPAVIMVRKASINRDAKHLTTPSRFAALATLYLPILDNRASALSFQVVYPCSYEMVEKQI